MRVGGGFDFARQAGVRAKYFNSFVKGIINNTVVLYGGRHWMARRDEIDRSSWRESQFYFQHFSLIGFLRLSVNSGYKTELLSCDVIRLTER
jgi:hypothetical protein